MEEIPEQKNNQRNYRNSSVVVKVREKSDRQKNQEGELSEDRNGRGSKLSKVFLEDYADN